MVVRGLERHTVNEIIFRLSIKRKNGETWNNRQTSCAAYYAIRARPASLHVLFQSSNSPGGRKLNLALALTEVKTNFSTTSTVYD